MKQAATCSGGVRNRVVKHLSTVLANPSTEPFSVILQPESDSRVRIDHMLYPPPTAREEDAAPPEFFRKSNILARTPIFFASRELITTSPSHDSHTFTPQALASESAPRLATEFSTQGLTNLAWSFAKLGHLDEALFQAISKAAIEWVADFNPQDVSNCAYAFAKLGQFDAELFRTLAGAVKGKLYSVLVQTSEEWGGRRGVERTLEDGECYTVRSFPGEFFLERIHSELCVFASTLVHRLVFFHINKNYLYKLLQELSL